MGKTIRSNNPLTKKYIKKRRRSSESCTSDHLSEYAKKHEKGNFPRRVWPTDSECDKHKGPKI